MKPDNKPARRKILKSEEVRQYEYAQRHKDDMNKRLSEMGYRSESEYNDCVSYLAW